MGRIKYIYSMGKIMKWIFISLIIKEAFLKEFVNLRVLNLKGLKIRREY